MLVINLDQLESGAIRLSKSKLPEIYTLVLLYSLTFRLFVEVWMKVLNR